MAPLHEFVLPRVRVLVPTPQAPLWLHDVHGCQHADGQPGSQLDVCISYAPLHALVEPRPRIFVPAPHEPEWPAHAVHGAQHDASHPGFHAADSLCAAPLHEFVLPRERVFVPAPHDPLWLHDVHPPQHESEHDEHAVDCGCAPGQPALPIRDRVLVPVPHAGAQPPHALHSEYAHGVWVCG